MYARLTLLEVDLVRMSIDAALNLYRAEVVPKMREQPGYRGVFVMTTPDGKGALLSLWDTEEQAATEGQAFYSETLGRFTTIFRSAPGRERYEVVYVDEPAHTG